MVISLYPLPFLVWVRIVVRGLRRNLAQGAGSAKTGTASDASLVCQVKKFFNYCMSLMLIWITRDM